MKTLLILPVLAGFALTACEQKAPSTTPAETPAETSASRGHQQVTQELADEIAALAATLDTVQNEATARKAAERFQTHISLIQELAAEAKNLPAPDSEQRKAHWSRLQSHDITSTRAKERIRTLSPKVQSILAPAFYKLNNTTDKLGTELKALYVAP